MKRLLTYSVASLLLIAASVFAQGGPSPVGSWDITINSPQGARTSLLVIRQEGDKLTGAMKSQRGERPLDSVTLKGNEITFVMTIPFQGSDMTITYTGKVEKDSMKGEADFGGLAQGDWSAVPHKEGASAPPSSGAPSGAPPSGAPPANAAPAINITGGWTFTVETAAGTGTPTFTFKQEGEAISGTYKGTFGEKSFTGTLKGSDLNFSVKVNFQGQDLEMVYAGKVESNNSMKGTVKLGDLGEGTWTAKRQ